MKRYASQKSITNKMICKTNLQTPRRSDNKYNNIIHSSLYNNNNIVCSPVVFY